MIDRFRKELDRALSHCLNPHAGAPITCNKDDRNIALLRLQPCLQFQTRDPWHLNLSYQTPDFTVRGGFEERLR